MTLFVPTPLSTLPSIKPQQAEGESGRGRLVVRSEGSVPQILESSHPYENNKDQTWVAEFPGATSIRVVFDDKTRTERKWVQGQGQGLGQGLGLGLG
jgi:hypothetical protein